MRVNNNNNSNSNNNNTHTHAHWKLLLQKAESDLCCCSNDSGSIRLVVWLLVLAVGGSLGMFTHTIE